jgi:hypothetical protein
MSDEPVKLYLYTSSGVRLDEEIDLGDVELGETKSYSLVLKNEEDEAVRNLEVQLVEDFAVKDFPSSLLGGEERPFILEYSPTSVDFDGGKRTVVKSGDEVELRVTKEFKGFIAITGEVIRVREF